MCSYTGVTITTTNLSAGKREFTFPSKVEFLAWKEKEEEASNTSYVKTTDVSSKVGKYYTIL